MDGGFKQPLLFFSRQVKRAAGYAHRFRILARLSATSSAFGFAPCVVVESLDHRARFHVTTADDRRRVDALLFGVSDFGLERRLVVLCVL